MAHAMAAGVRPLSSVAEHGADRMPSVVVPRFLLDGHRAADRFGRRRQGDADRRRRSGSRRGNARRPRGGRHRDRPGDVRPADHGWGRPLGPQHLRRRRTPPAGRDGGAENLLTNSAGAYASAMAEYTVAGMIMLSRNLPSWLEGQRERRWLEADSFEASLLRGKRLGIVGYGAVGRELAVAARALGMEVWATKRSPCSSAASRSTGSCLRTRSTSCSPRATSSPCAPR